MRVRLLISRAGKDFVQQRGDVIDVEPAEGKRLVDAGQALPEKEQKVETAMRAAGKARARG